MQTFQIKTIIAFQATLISELWLLMEWTLVTVVRILAQRAVQTSQFQQVSLWMSVSSQHVAMHNESLNFYHLS